MFTSNKLKQEDLCQFFRIIRRYYKVGLTLNESMREYTKAIEKPALKAIGNTIIRDMRNGVDFEESLKKYPTFFPAFIIELIKVGQKSGRMGEFLDEIVFYLEQDIEVHRELKSALWMPKIFLFGMSIAFAIGFLFVIPKLGELLTDAHLELPFITKIIIGIGTTAQHFWWVFLIIGVISFFYYKYLKQNQPEKIETLSLKIPFFKVINYNRLQYNFAKILGLCITAGIKTSKALNYTAMASGNVIMKNTLLNVATDLENSGMQIADAIKKADKHKIIDPNFYVMLAVGNTSGKIGPIMLAESENYRKEMLIAARLIGDKIGLSVTVPGYICLVALFASIEFPVMKMMQNLGKLGGM